MEDADGIFHTIGPRGHVCQIRGNTILACCCIIVRYYLVGAAEIADTVLKLFHENRLVCRQPGAVTIEADIEAAVSLDVTSQGARKVDFHK
jgi:hypothetical protein